MNTNNADIVVLAAFYAGAATKAVDIEYIAEAAHSIAPTRFVWRHFPDRIDLRTVQYALKDALRRSDPKIAGSLKSGYQLTPAGLEWAQGLTDPGDQPDISSASDDSLLRAPLRAERARLRRSVAAHKILSGEARAVTDRDFESFTRTNGYFSSRLRSQRYQAIENAVRGDTELQQVWSELYQRFIEGEQSESP